MDRKRFYITTAIDYVNQKPHLGTAYEKIGADCMARFKRLCGYDTYLLMGNDEHSTNVEREARSRGLDPLEYCRLMSSEFQGTWKALDISYDDFIHTTEERHVRGVRELFAAINANGYICKGKYEGYYCESCEEYIVEKDLVDGLCPRHKLPPKFISEDNYFFALSRFEEPLARFFERNPDFVRPQIRFNEVKNVVKGGLRDVSISRAGKTWGIPLPIDESHVIYVWFDALSNYITALGYGSPAPALFDRYWPADVHVIGKDITRFHCIIWPSMLMAAGIEPPRSVFAHGFLSLGGEKMSKTRGNIIDPRAMAERFGADALRYLLLREVPFDRDGDISIDSLVGRYNADLANDIGNLFSRTLVMIVKYLGGSVEAAEMDPARGIYGELESAVGAYRAAMERMEFSSGLAAYWAVVQRANRFIEERRPWDLAKDAAKRGELEDTCRELLAVLRTSAVVLSPFMPAKMEEMGRQLGLGKLAMDNLPEKTVGSRGLASPHPLFPRMREGGGELAKG
jgi:methionyl-tRNA synthetase